MSQMRLLLSEQARAFCTQDLRTVRDLENFLHGMLAFSRRDALEIASRFVGKSDRRLAAANVRTVDDLELSLRLAGYSQTEARDIAARFNPKAEASPPSGGRRAPHHTRR
jgi:hypothetical protein